MKKYSIKVFILSMVVVMAVVPFAACGSAPVASTAPSPSAADDGLCSVQFDLNYSGAENNIEAESVKSGELAVQPAAEPVRDGYSFEGWFSDKDMKAPFDFTTAKITADSTLYAGWSEAVYYIAGNFTGYEAKKAGFSMKTVDGEDGWYWITVQLTPEVRDATYDGHYYKITNGTWDANGCWGADNYAVQPAPVSPTGGGLGSVWVYNDCTLNVLYDSVNKVIYDDSMTRNFATPRIYGDFNAAMGRGADWSTADGEALELADANADGIFEGIYKIPAYAGTAADGYSMAVALNEKYYITQWGHSWGANEQYKFDGTAAGMGGVSFLKPAADTIYEFKYDSKTHVTTATECTKDQVVAFENPVVYGDFSGWLFEGGTSLTLKDEDGDGVYTGTLKLAPYTGTDKGYMLAVALSKKMYDDDYGARWGVEEQYLFDGSAAAMGAVSYLKPEKDTTYTLSYDSKTHKTKVDEE